VIRGVEVHGSAVTFAFRYDKETGVVHIWPQSYQAPPDSKQIELTGDEYWSLRQIMIEGTDSSSAV
jgi:hypothetical protein